MKKVITLALALMASASFNVATAAKKKKKEEAKPSQVQLVSSSDTLSYVAGMAFTEGLLPYLKQSQNIDTANIADFIRGFEDMIAAKGDMKMKAYAAGMTIAGQLTEHMIPGMANEFKDSPDSLVTDIVTRGFADALRKDTTLFTQNAAEELFKAKREADKKAKEEKLYGENRRAGEQFLADNAKKDSVVVLPSGLQYKVLVKGEGEIPKMTDKVMVNYEGRLIDGTVFDSSAKHGQGPASFRANQVIKGWTEALTMMPAGSKWQLFIPQELAYGERNAGQIKPFSALIFDVELVGIDDPKAKIEELKKTKNEKTAAKKTAVKK